MLAALRQLKAAVLRWYELARWIEEVSRDGLLVSCRQCNGTGSTPPRASTSEPWDVNVHKPCPGCNGLWWTVRRAPGAPK